MQHGHTFRYPEKGQFAEFCLNAYPGEIFRGARTRPRPGTSGAISWVSARKPNPALSFTDIIEAAAAG